MKYKCYGCDHNCELKVEKEIDTTVPLFCAVHSLLIRTPEWERL